MASDDWARAKGWHIWRSKNEMGEVVKEDALCPDHSGNQKRQPHPQHFEGEQTLW